MVSAEGAESTQSSRRREQASMRAESKAPFGGVVFIDGNLDSPLVITWVVQLTGRTR